jgi:achaete-scute complex protein
MSKVETLRCAVEYIKNLKTMLDLNGVPLQSSTPSSTISSGNDSNDVNHHFRSNASEFGSSSDPLGHYHHVHHHHQHFGTSSASTTTTVPAGSHQLSPSSSDDPSSPSYASEASYITTSNNNNNNNANTYDYENYEPVSPEDEELLDAISWWQQS